MVWVEPGRLPAKVMVAPNSPSARAQHSAAPAPSDGPISGSVTRRNTSQRPAPRVAAASSKRRSIERRPASTVTTRKGSATNASASTAPAVVNGSVTPNARSSHMPASPRRPNASSSATPPTTQGSTMGSVVSARTRSRPGKATRASRNASGSPSSSDSAAAPSEHSSDSRNAVSTSGAVRSWGRLSHGVRSSRPASGRTRNATPHAAGTTNAAGAQPRPALNGRSRGGRRQEPEAGEGLLALRGQDEVHERLRLPLVRARLDGGDRVGGRHVLRGGDRDPVDLALGRGHIGDVHDAGVGFAQRDLVDRRLDVVLERDRPDGDPPRV